LTAAESSASYLGYLSTAADRLGYKPACSAQRLLLLFLPRLRLPSSGRGPLRPAGEGPLTRQNSVARKTAAGRLARWLLLLLLFSPRLPLPSSDRGPLRLAGEGPLSQR
jgi:hypothetical protein